MGVEYRYLVDNERGVNRFLIKCLAVCCFLGPVLIVCGTVWNYRISTIECFWVTLLSLGFLIATICLEKIPRWQKWNCYLLTVGLHFVVCYVSTLEGWNLNIAYAVVPALSCLYFNPRFTLYSSGICYSMLLYAMYLRSFGETIVNGGAMDQMEWFVTNAFWITIEFFALTVLDYLLACRLYASYGAVKGQNQKMQELQKQLVFGFANLVESRDSDTGEHAWRTGEYVRMISMELRKSGNYVEELNPETLRRFMMAAPLHDIGKLCVPDSVLHKKGRLTEEEYQIIKKHTSEGHRLVSENLSHLGDAVLLKSIQDTVLYHHEWWDGSGYPTGIEGKDIPLCARIMSAADALDALLSDRCYKKHMEIDEALQLFEQQRGTHFEPVIVDAVLKLKPQISQFLQRMEQK